MIVQIDPKSRIRGTNHCWELQRLRKRNGDQSWEAYKWCISFCSALEEAVHRDIRLHPAYGLAEAIEAVSGLVQRYERLIPAEYQVAWHQTKPQDD